MDGALVGVIFGEVLLQNRIVLFSLFYSCSIPGPLMPVIWILGCVHKPPFLSQHPRAETAPGTPKNKTKMHLHAPGVELPHDVFFKAVFNLWIISALPCMAALQEMQGHLMVPQPCSHLTAPPVQAGEGDLFHCSKALALEKSCEKNATFFTGKKKSFRDQIHVSDCKEKI